MSQQALDFSSLSVVALRVGAFAATFVASLIACPLLAFPLSAVLPRVVGNFLFFWPQLALVPFGFTYPADDMTRTYLGGGPNYAIAGTFWLLVGVGLSWLLRRRPVRLTAFITLPVSFAIAIAVAAILYCFDVGIYFEGP